MLLEKKNEVWVYMKSLKGGSIALAFFNPSSKEKKYVLKNDLMNEERIWTLRDVWKHTDAGILKDNLSFTLQPHETIVLKATSSK